MVVKVGKGRKKQATGTRKTGKLGEKQAKGGVKRVKKTGIALLEIGIEK